MRGAAKLFILTLVGSALVACVGPRWRASAALIDSDRLVADAFSEPAPHVAGPIAPEVPPPTGLRPCCALGMDQRVRYGGVPLYGYAISTVTGPELFGAHEYDNGTMSLQSNGNLFGLERNGIVYTCRGGFIDTAHVRDNADMTFFLASRLLSGWPKPTTVSFETDDAWVEVSVAWPEVLRAVDDPYVVVADVAGWLGYQQGLWHEIAQWWGYESVAGYAEAVSAFSSEDFYSNALGVKLGALAVRHRLFRSREDYNAGIDALLQSSMRLLQAQSKDVSRQAMAAVDKRWWDSGFELPDNRAVPKRSFAVQSPLVPWTLDDVPNAPVGLCQGAAKRSLSWPSQVSTPMKDDTDPRAAELAIASFAHIEWHPKAWSSARFPFVAQSQKATSDDLGRLVRATREDMLMSLSADAFSP